MVDQYAIQAARDTLERNGVFILLSISTEDIKDIAASSDMPEPSFVDCMLIAKEIDKEWQSGDEWQYICDRVQDKLND